MDLKEIVSEALDTFEVQVATEYLEGRDGFRGAPDNIANHTASRKAALAWAEQYFKICTVRSSRGRHVKRAQSTATSKLRLMAAIEEQAIAHRFSAGPSNPVWDVLDLSEDAVLEVRRQCHAVFWKHEMNTTLLELDRRYPEQIRTHTSSPSNESASDTAGTPSDEGSSLPTESISTPATEPDDAHVPATPPSPSQKDPQSSDQPLQVFTWTNWKGEAFSSDYSEAYRTSPVAQQSRLRKGGTSKNAAHIAKLAPASQQEELHTAPPTEATSSQVEPLRERHESKLAEAAVSSPPVSDPQGKIRSRRASVGIERRLSIHPVLSPDMVLHHNNNDTDEGLSALPVREALVMPLTNGDTVLKTDHTSSPVENAPAIQTPETGADEALSGGRLVDHAEERTVRGAVARCLGEIGDEVYALAAGFCMAAAVRLALLIFQ